MSAQGESLFGQYKDEVRSRLSLRDLVEACHPKKLRSTGKNSILCCSPLRKDESPSFSVFEGGGEYIAFDHATKESFDLYAFVQKRESLDFVDAVKWCGDRAGLPWDEYKQQHGGGGGRSPPPVGFTEEEWSRAQEKVLALDEREMVAGAQQAMVDCCHSLFIRSDRLVRYVEEKWGISEETQQRFMLGIVPYGFAQVLEDLHEQGAFSYSRKQLAKTGWFLPRPRVAGDPDPELRCIFEGRLVYPYLLRGKCRYAAARILFENKIDPAYFERAPWEQAKFKKALVGGESHPSVSPFVQNDLLYNADNATRSRTSFARIVIVEGPSDCMAMVEAGYDCVAPVTTSVRSEDVPMLLEAVSKYKEVVLATDTDVKPDGRRPGLEGALRMAPELMRAGKRVRLLVFPLPVGESKVDPASWALAWKRAGKEGDPFAELMEKVPGVAAALVQFLREDYTAAELPEALDPIVRLTRAGKASKAEVEEVARLVKERLRGNFTKTAIKQAMGEADERLEAARKADAAALGAIQDDKILDIEGRVVERGGHDQPGKVRCYQGYAKDGTPVTVSTFLLQPSRIIISGNGDRQLEVSVHIETDTSLIERWVVPKLAWTGRKAFVSSFPHERMQFNGSDFNVHSVYQIVSERAARLGVPTVRGEPVVGLHRTAGGLRLVLPTETWNSDGVMDNPDIVYTTDSGSVSFCSMLRVDGRQDPSEVDPLIARLLALIFTLNDPVKLTTLCSWIVGCYFLPEIRELNGNKASILDVYGSHNSGKCLAPGTKVLRYDGTTAPVESIQIGDQLMGADSKPRLVLSVDMGCGPMRRIVPNKGDPWECNDIHVLTLVHSKTGEVRDMAVTEWESMKFWKRRLWLLFMPERVDFSDGDDLPIDPYFVGLWLGDGTKEADANGRIRAVAITKPDVEVVQVCESIAATYGIRVRSHDRSPGNPTHHLAGERKKKPNKLLDALRGLWPGGYDGSIPREYLLSSREHRLQLLAGLLDTDGEVNFNFFEITQKNRRTADDIAFLARSLGFRVTERDSLYEGTERRSEPTDKTTTYRRLRILGDCSVIPTRIARKRAGPRKRVQIARRTGFTVEHLADGPFFGFELDGDGRFLLGDFTVTHNTTLMQQVLNKTFQPFGPNFEPGTPAGTRFATIRNLSWSNVFLSAFDEYRASESGSDFMRLIRTGFSGGSEQRGSRDQSVRSYELHGAVQLSGEQRADVDAAMGERLVMVALDQIGTKDTPEGLAEILATEERWRVATDILQWRMRIDHPTILGWWSQAKIDAADSLDRMKLRVASRTRDLCAELALRLRAWNEWLDHRAQRRAEVPRPSIDSILRLMLETTTGLEIPEGGGNVMTVSAKSLVVRALEDITPYAVRGKFEDHKCYRIADRNGRRMLVVHPGSLAVTLAQEAKARGQLDPTNGEAALKRAAKEEYERSGVTGWLVDPNFPYRMGSADDVGEEHSRPIRMRCWLIDIEKAAERVGLELDWPGTPATWGGDRRKSAPLPPWRKPTGDGGA